MYNLVKNSVKKCISPLLITQLIYLISLPAMANITVKLNAPQWEFLLQNEPWESSQAQLQTSERHFARKVQPLLANGEHQAIMQAFNEREINDDGAALRLLRGQVLLSLKHYAQAEHALQSALTLMPNLALAHRSLSMVYMLDKNYNKAQFHLTKTIALGVADAQAYGQLAYVNLQLDQAASAVSGYQYALFLDADNSQWQQGLLYALIQSQALDQAQALIDELLNKSPNNTDLWLQRGQIALEKNRPKQALASIEAALSLGINDADNIAYASQLHIQHGSPHRAIELLSQHSERLIAAGKVSVLDQIAAWLVYENNWSQLESLLAAVNKVSSTNVNTNTKYRSRFLLYKAQMLMADRTTHAAQLSLLNNSKSSQSSQSSQSRAIIKTRVTEAQNYLQEAIQNDPSNGEALLTLAGLLSHKHLNDQAILYYTRAKAFPDFKERALLGHAQLAIDAQNYAEALRLLRQVIQHNPARNDLLANIQSLESLTRSQG